MTNEPPMQQLQLIELFANELLPVMFMFAHMQFLGSKVKFLVVTLLVLLRHEQFQEASLVRLLI